MRARLQRAGAEPGSVRIVAVTKGQSLAACRAAVAVGLTDLGENRVQEALTKMGQVPGADWHLVGRLQTNKARHSGRFALIQSLDSARAAEAVARRAVPAAPPVLLEVNVAGAPQRPGVAPEQALEVAASVGELLDLRGLMAIAPLGADPGPSFRFLRRLRDEAEQRLGRELPMLSMGMSDDFEAAVREGSTMVRLGRVLFGLADSGPG
ncbi:MAG: YggS family pyridoxal phosphate-dependent enzyme [Candidatus Dormibacteraeota bacterium]|nr:YggS family pyridoxal phosphate-dependent enzyme [Candidatus Dormibacteraeota bacterium]